MLRSYRVTLDQKLLVVILIFEEFELVEGNSDMLDVHTFIRLYSIADRNLSGNSKNKLLESIRS